MVKSTWLCRTRKPMLCRSDAKSHFHTFSLKLKLSSSLHSGLINRMSYLLVTAMILATTSKPYHNLTWCCSEAPLQHQVPKGTNPPLSPPFACMAVPFFNLNYVTLANDDKNLLTSTTASLWFQTSFRWGAYM